MLLLYPISYRSVLLTLFLFTQVSTANQPAAWNSTCAQGKVQATAQYWANTVKNMYPGYTGARPRFQVYHGSADATARGGNRLSEFCCRRGSRTAFLAEITGQTLMEVRAAWIQPLNGHLCTITLIAILNAVQRRDAGRIPDLRVR